MFSYLTSFLYRFQSKPVRTIALVALAVLVAAVLLGSFVRWLRRRRQYAEDNWAGLVVDLAGSALKVLIALGVLAVLGLHLAFQSTEFARLRGGVSARNYDAVSTIWGRPHVQRELSVRLGYQTTQFLDKDGLELDPNKLRATTQPVGYRKQVVEHTIPGNPISQAEHGFRVRMNYRQKGGAWYPGFETDAAFSYIVENFADREADAHFEFPLPAGQGLVDQIQVAIDGKPIRQKLLVTESGIRWQMPLAAGKGHSLTVRYHSRGMDYLRFEPGAGRQLERYRLKLVCDGVAKDEINYPVGCMTPTEGPTEAAGKDEAGNPIAVTTLGWNLDRAVTRLGMGVILPKKQQPGYHVARVLDAAPWGLVLLLAMVLVTHLATAGPPHWLPLTILAVGYYLYYLLMAHVGDYAPGLVGGMVIAGVILTALVAALQWVWYRPFLVIATLALFAVFCFVYPLIRISDWEGLGLTILYVALLAYVIGLLVARRRGDARMTNDEC